MKHKMLLKTEKGFLNVLIRPVESIYDVWQVHGNDVIVADKARPPGTLISLLMVSSRIRQM